MNLEDRSRLIAAALAVRDQAYAPYSNFRVGAALLAESGQIIAGCNVENASYGMTICAERTAAFAAVAQGFTRFQALALVTDGGALPCGACRQVLAEFCDDLPIWVVDIQHPDRIAEYTLNELLPGRFTL